MRNGQNSVVDIISAVAGSVVVAAVALVGVVRMADDARANGPVPGDIVAFSAGMPVAQTDLRIVASTTAAHPVLCLLEPREIAAAGGSLIVEASDGGHYHVHWAGGRSSGGSANCGRARDLVISRADLESLAVAAGGFGAVTRNLVPQPATTTTNGLP